MTPTLAVEDTQPTLDELLNLPPERGPDQPTTQSDGLDPTIDLNPEGTLFDRAINDMHRSSTRMGELTDIGPTTQRLHESIIASLDQLIEEAKKRQGGSGSDSGSSGSPRQTSRSGMGQPTAGGSQPSQGQAGTGAGGAAGSHDQRTGNTARSASWGHLPQRVRDELQQGLAEPFSPVYQRLTEDYYKVLAEQDSTPE